MASHSVMVHSRWDINEPSNNMHSGEEDMVNLESANEDFLQMMHSSLSVGDHNNKNDY